MMGETGPSIVALAQMQQGRLLLASLKAKALKNNDLETQKGTSTVPGGKRETKNVKTLPSIAVNPSNGNIQATRKPNNQLLP